MGINVGLTSSSSSVGVDFSADAEGLLVSVSVDGLLTVAPGVAYVGGMRVELDSELSVEPPIGSMSSD